MKYLDEIQSKVSAALRPSVAKALRITTAIQAGAIEARAEGMDETAWLTACRQIWAALDVSWTSVEARLAAGLGTPAGEGVPDLAMLVDRAHDAMKDHARACPTCKRSEPCPNYQQLAVAYEEAVKVSLAAAAPPASP